MSHLAETLVCPHCGERYNVREQQNRAGDVVRRGVCPSVPVNAPAPPWATPWELVSRAAIPRSALTPGEVETLERGEGLSYLPGVTAASLATDA